VYGSAPEVAAFELEVFEFLERFVKEEGVDCDWYVVFSSLFCRTFQPPSGLSRASTLNAAG
jgi:hypothetical protein